MLNFYIEFESDKMKTGVTYYVYQYYDTWFFENAKIDIGNSTAKIEVISFSLQV